jgi:hypothetical protein
MSLSSFFSSLVGTLYADAPEETNAPEPDPQEEVAAEEVDEEEPEDVRLPVPLARGPFVAEPGLLGVLDPSQIARRGAGVHQVQGYRSALSPLPRKSSVREGFQA